MRGRVYITVTASVTLLLAVLAITIEINFDHLFIAELIFVIDESTPEAS